jgi:hypothetical protein
VVIILPNVILTKSTDKVLCQLYKEYLSRIKNNISKSNALIFDTTSISQLFGNQDIDFEISELKKNSLIEAWITGEVLLRSEAIVYMENRFKNGLIEITDFIAKFKP